MGLLQKINWKTRRWNIKINLLDIFIHDGDGCWGFTLLEVVKDYNSYALLAFEFRLPNGAERTKIQITNWDFFYSSTPLYDWANDTKENMLWGYKPTVIQKIGIKIVEYIF